MEWGVESLMYSWVPSAAMILIVLCICSISVSQDRTNNLTRIIATCRHGRYRYTLSKLLIVTMATAVFSILIYGSQFIAACKLYGMGDMSRPMQSVTILQESARTLSLGEFLIDYYVRNIISLIVIAIAAECIMLAANSMLMSLVIIMTIGAASLWGYFSVTSLEGNSWMHFLNPVAWFSGAELYGGYWNVNLLGTPVNPIKANSVIKCIIIMVSITVSECFLSKKLPSAKRQKTYMLQKKLQCIRERMPYTSRVLLQESKRQLIKNRLLLLFAAVVGILLCMVRTRPIDFAREDMIYREYAHKYEGEADERLLENLQSEEEYFNSLREKQKILQQSYFDKEISEEQYTGLYDALEKMLESEKGLMRAKTQAESLVEWKDKHGEMLFFVDTLMADYLFANAKNNQYRGALIITLMIIIISGIFTQDKKNDMWSILLTTKKGHSHLFVSKYIVGIVMAMLLNVSSIVLYMYEAGKMYEFSHWEIPVQSFAQTQNITVSMSVMQYFVISELMQTLAVGVIASAVISLSVFMKNRMYAIMLGVSIFVLPVLVGASGVLAKLSDYWIGAVFNFDIRIAKQGATAQIAYLFVLMAISAILAVKAWRKYAKRGEV